LVRCMNLALPKLVPEAVDEHVTSDHCGKLKPVIEQLGQGEQGKDPRKRRVKDSKV